MAISKWIPWFIVPLIIFYFAGEASNWFPSIVADQIKILVDYNATFLPKGFFTLPSGKEWNPTTGQIMILFGVLILAVELFKSTQASHSSIIDHILSIIVFICYFAFFLSKPWAKSDVFLILGTMSFLDVISGFTIAIAIAKRDIAISGG
jgi:hypothetical protein